MLPPLDWWPCTWYSNPWRKTTTSKPNNNAVDKFNMNEESTCHWNAPSLHKGSINQSHQVFHPRYVSNKPVNEPFTVSASTEALILKTCTSVTSHVILTALVESMALFILPSVGVRLARSRLARSWQNNIAWCMVDQNAVHACKPIPSCLSCWNLTALMYKSDTSCTRWFLAKNHNYGNILRLILSINNSMGCNRGAQEFLHKDTAHYVHS